MGATSARWNRLVRRGTLRWASKTRPTLLEASTGSTSDKWLETVGWAESSRPTARCKGRRDGCNLCALESPGASWNLAVGLEDSAHPTRSLDGEHKRQVAGNCRVGRVFEAHRKVQG